MITSFSPTTIISLLSLGLIAGFLSGVLGIGGGIVVVPLLILLFGVDPHKAVGVSIAMIVPTALVAALKHNSLSPIDLRFVLIIVIASIIGAYFGSIASHQLPDQTLKKIFGAALIILGLNMVFSTQPNVSERNETVAR